MLLREDEDASHKLLRRRGRGLRRGSGRVDDLTAAGVGSGMLG